jgi:UDP-N-acetyl-D-mannosaminuronate dehydrogenase
MKIGILGMGVVGKALYSLYRDNNIKVFGRDKKFKKNFSSIDILNICIPYSDDFVKIITEDIIKYKPIVTIIHSTVPVGTTKVIIKNTKSYIVHSPIIGSHSSLKKSLKTFVKYIGSDDKKALNLADKHFKKLKIKTKKINNSDTTELLKLLCTTYYGLNITWHNYVYNIFKQKNIDFSLIQEWNTNYNNGYKKLKKMIYNRPILYPPENGKIGGTCVIPNAFILNEQHPSNLILEILKLK